MVDCEVGRDARSLGHFCLAPHAPPSRPFGRPPSACFAPAGWLGRRRSWQCKFTKWLSRSFRLSLRSCRSFRGRIGHSLFSFELRRAVWSSTSLSPSIGPRQSPGSALHRGRVGQRVALGHARGHRVGLHPRGAGSRHPRAVRQRHGNPVEAHAWPVSVGAGVSDRPRVAPEFRARGRSGFRSAGSTSGR